MSNTPAYFKKDMTKCPSQGVTALISLLDVEMFYLCHVIHSNHDKEFKKKEL